MGEEAGDRRPRVALDVAVLLATVAWEAFVVVRWQHRSPDFSALRVAGSAVTALLFAVCGVVARHRTPYTRMGAMLFIAGACLMAEDLSVIGGRIDDIFSPLTGAASAFGFALAAFSFPTGRLRGRIDFWLIAAIAVYAFLIGPVSRLSTSCPCTVHDLGFRASTSLDSSISRVEDTAGLAVLCCAAALFGYRCLTATKPERRMVAPFLVACFVIAVINLPKVVDSGTNLVGDFLPLSFGLAPLAMLLGLARVRMVRVGVTSIVRELDNATSLPQLRLVLQRSLGDKSIEIRTWDASADVWRDENGEAITDQLVDPGSLRTPIDHRDGRRLGVLLHDPALAHDPELLEAVVGTIRLALENSSLHEEVSVQLARAADAADGERRRVARDLHDGAQQRLVSLMLDVAALSNRLSHSIDPEVQALLASILTGARASLTDLRSLVYGLSPATLHEEGLGSAISELAMGVRAVVELDDRLSARQPAAIESGAFLMTAEALANVSKHAGARAVRILLEQRAGELHVAISDDGRGGAEIGAGSGLIGLYERAEALGGRVTISSPQGRGTTVSIHLPAGPASTGPPPPPLVVAADE
jgi:signal transduction histidine kinase